METIQSHHPWCWNADAMALQVFPRPRRVFIGYTFELLKPPTEESFVEAADSDARDRRSHGRAGSHAPEL
jgi:hypothetical protein